MAARLVVDGAGPARRPAVRVVRRISGAARASEPSAETVARTRESAARMGIPPHAARLAGTWPVHAGRWAPAPSTEAATQHRDRSRRGVGVRPHPGRDGRSRRPRHLPRRRPRRDAATNRSASTASAASAACSPEATTVPARPRVSTSPAASSSLKARATVLAARPRSTASARTVGSRSPGTSRPERMSASTCARTCSKGASRAGGVDDDVEFGHPGSNAAGRGPVNADPRVSGVTLQRWTPAGSVLGPAASIYYVM